MKENFDHLKTFEDYRDALATMISGSMDFQNNRLSYEKKEAVPERLMQSIWLDGHIKKDGLKTISGKEIEILSPGRLNRESGPDFLAGEIRINGETLKGDIEIHIHASDWIRHEHDNKFEYNQCILHAFLYHDDREKRDILFNGNVLERLHLEPYLYPDLKTLRETLSEDDFAYHEGANQGKCARILGRLDSEFLSRFFDLAGDKRMDEKTERLRRQLSGETYDQVFYQALMASMGYKGSKTLFFLLSKRAPLEELLDYSRDRDPDTRILIIQSILFHIANLVPMEREKKPSLDEETLVYLNILNRWWMEYSGYFNDRILPQTTKWFAHVRPANFPTRRIAGIAQLIVRLSSNGGFFKGFADWFRQGAEADLEGPALKRFLRDAEKLLTITGDPYWTHRFNFASRKSQRALTLIGADRARTVLFNALIPMMLLKAENDSDTLLEGFVRKCIKFFPPLSENIVTKFMQRRIFSDAGLARQYIFNERRRQSLFKIFYDCCNNNEVTCDDCYFYRKTREQVSDA
jgi:hypothetical protein